MISLVQTHKLGTPEEGKRWVDSVHSHGRVPKIYPTGTFQRLYRPSYLVRHEKRQWGCLRLAPHTRFGQTNPDTRSLLDDCSLASKERVYGLFCPSPHTTTTRLRFGPPGGNYEALPRGASWLGSSISHLYRFTMHILGPRPPIGCILVEGGGLNNVPWIGPTSNPTARSFALTPTIQKALSSPPSWPQVLPTT